MPTFTEQFVINSTIPGTPKLTTITLPSETLTTNEADFVEAIIGGISFTADGSAVLTSASNAINISFTASENLQGTNEVFQKTLVWQVSGIVAFFAGVFLGSAGKTVTGTYTGTIVD